MAFCNSCGATLDPSTKFCKKCGAPNVAQVSAPGPVPVAASAAGPPGSGQSSGALKVILIVAAVIVAVGILGMATLGIITWRIAKSSHVRQEGDHVKVETPFGTVESTKDPEAAVRNLGVELYPGAQVLKSGAASAGCELLQSQVSQRHGYNLRSESLHHCVQPVEESDHNQYPRYG